jgi:hypothetical protein
MTRLVRYHITVVTVPVKLVKKHCMQDAQAVFMTMYNTGSQEVYDFNKSTGTPVKF